MRKKPVGACLGRIGLGVAASSPGATALLIATVMTSAPAGLQGDALPLSTGILPELIQVLRTNLDLGSQEFDSRASEALIERFGVRRKDPTETASTTPIPAPPTPADLIARQERLEGGVLYLRLGRIEAGLAQATRSALTRATSGTNASPPASGLVLDLRFARGESLPAAGETAALFSDRTEAILDWGGGSVTGSGAERGWSLPMAVLVNGRTEGAAEALAAALRQETGSALVGQATAGTHGVFREVTLKDGTRLQVPAGRIRLGGGSILADGPITPDIRIPVAEAAERAFLANPTATLGQATTAAAAGSTNTVAGAQAQTPGSAPLQRRKVTEADLVRAQRSDPSEAGSETASPIRPSAPVRLADPVLSRAADLVRGLAAFRKGR